MNPLKPFSIDEFLHKLEAGDPEVALDPRVIHGMERLASAIQAPVAPRAHLLLVDDNDDDALLFDNALKQNGIAIGLTRVRDGKAAIDYFEGRGDYVDRSRFPLPNLTILDLDIPRLGGLQVLKHIRSLPGCMDSVVIVLTGSNKELDKEEANILKTSAYLSKPSTIDGLIELVRQVKVSWLDKLNPGAC